MIQMFLFTAVTVATAKKLYNSVTELSGDIFNGDVLIAGDTFNSPEPCHVR